MFALLVLERDYWELRNMEGFHLVQMGVVFVH